MYHNTVKNVGIFLIAFAVAQYGFAEIKITESVLNDVRRKFGLDAQARVVNLRDVLYEAKDDSEEDKLFKINRYFNKTEFIDDFTHWNKKDYWATPFEFLGTNAGDCEDFVIAKYFALVELNISKDKLRLMYVTATRPNRQAHMVLAYYPTPGSIPLVLDNINKRILPASQRRDLIPVYSFNGDGLWLAKSHGQGRKMQDGGNNSLWQDLVDRMKKESK